MGHHKTRNFIISIDGTGNDPTDKNITNVLKLHRALDHRQPHQVAWYYAGVGNELEYGRLVQKLGFIFGVGARRLRQRVYRQLGQQYRPGDRLFIFGFSRGAAIARMLARLIDRKGIQGHPVEIELLGVWDTVAAFGIPMDLGPFSFQRINLFRDFRVPANVKKAYHLVAVDERHTPFRPTLMNASNWVEEIWFPGAHLEVGGGVAYTGLSDISLKFMIDRATECGLAFDPEKLAAIEPDVTAPLLKFTLNLPRRARELTVMVDNKPTDIPPKIHHTVFDRMEALGNPYQPENILALGERFQKIGPGDAA